MEKQKLLILSPGLSSNGIDMFVLNVLKNIDTSKYDITLAIAIDEGVKSLNDNIVSQLDIKVVHICDLDGIAKKKRYFKALYELMCSEKFDIIHSNMDLINGIILYSAKKAGIKKRICHAHTSKSQFGLNGDKSKAMMLLQKVFYYVMRTLIIKNSTVLLGCSNIANVYFYGKNKAKTAKIINNGIELSKYINPGDIDTNRYIFEGFDKTKINLITVGRISPPKNPLMIVDIVYELSILRDDFVFNWVGSGEMLDQVTEKIKEKNIGKYFKFWGVRTDVNKILSCCDYFIFPSLFEGLGIVAIEAQAVGLTCFVSDTVPELANVGGCKFIDLSSSANNWAKIIDSNIKENVHLEIDKDLLYKFDINYTVSQLEKVYSD